MISILRHVWWSDSPHHFSRHDIDLMSSFFLLLSGGFHRILISELKQTARPMFPIIASSYLDAFNNHYACCKYFNTGFVVL